MRPRRSFVFVCLAVGLSTTSVMGGVDLDGLLKKSPFGAPAPENTPAPPAPQTLELRGVVHEGGAVYLTFFDSASKKWLSLTPGEESGGYALEGFDEATAAATLRSNGRALTVAMKMEGAHPRAVRPAIANVAAAAKPQPAPAATVITPGLSAAEAHRLELVASEIRQQIERAKFLAASAETSATF